MENNESKFKFFNKKLWITIDIIACIVICIVVSTLFGKGILKSSAGKPLTARFKEDNQLDITINQNSEWKDYDVNGYTYEVILKNISDKDITDWSLDIKFDQKIEVQGFWSGEYEAGSDGIVVKPLDYNKVIKKDGQVNFGFILNSVEKLDINKIKVNQKGTIAKDESDDTDTDKPTEETAKPEETPEATPEATKEAESDKPTKKPVASNTTEKGTPVDNHGKLSLKGTDIVDKNGKVYVLKGVSTHGIQWFGQYVNKDAFKTMRDDWGINVVRLAMYTDPNVGYTEKMHDLVDEGVQYATELGLYVIIDWHILSDGNPNTYKDNAIDYFKKVSKKYKDYDNVIYEICNEPNGDITWDKDVKPYAEDVVSTIRKNDKDSIIIVGSPTWSQDVHLVAENPLKGFDNIMYSLHFYAATHKDDLRNRMVEAKKSGIPIFVTEFGICDASGNGAIDYESANQWMDVMNENNISFAIWNLSNKDEASALIKSSVSKTSGWKKSELSDEGKWFLEIMGK